MERRLIDTYYFFIMFCSFREKELHLYPKILLNLNAPASKWRSLAKRE